MPDSPQDADSPSRPRGLWSLMGQSPDATGGSDDLAPPPRSLFAVMRQGSPTDDLAAQSPPVPIGTPSDPSESAEIGLVLENQSTDAVIEQPLLNFSATRTNSDRQARERRQGQIALVCGMAALVLSALSLAPGIWMSIPASICGFIAILRGYFVFASSSSQSDRPTRRMSQAAMLLGTVGIFLGPTVLSSYGRLLRESSGNQFTRKNLTLLGGAIRRFEDQHGHYPIGGTVAVGADPGPPLHGWMTSLLPFIGQQSLYSSIDLSRPFNSLDNRSAMSHDVDAFFAAGGDRSKTEQGLAVAHFAGLGGDLREEAGWVHVGIFSQNAAVRPAEITDGLANTLIIGELGKTFPAWGSAENWRKIGRGLNREFQGFGNASGTGAMFLFADGSVKLFDNETDPKLLEQLSTRDGNRAASN